MRELARRQHGLVGVAQAYAAGADRRALRRRVAAGEWDRVGPHVLRLAGMSTTFHQRCLAAVLDGGASAVVSSTAAARLWSLPGFRGEGVHVSRAGRGTHRPSTLATTHHPRFLPEHHRTVLGAVPVTTVARTVFDLAGCVHPLRTERALDNALNARMVGLEELRAVTIELVARGRKGSALMRLLLDERGAGYIPPASGLEAGFLALIVACGLELPECQIDLGGESWIGRVDFYYRRCRLVVETDSDRYHGAKLDQESDERRDAALRAAGFEVLRVDEHKLRDRPHEVVEPIRAALLASPA